MFAYKIFDFDYDDSLSCVLLHEKEFTKEEFENIVNECRKNRIRMIRGLKNSIIKETDTHKKISKECELRALTRKRHMFEDICDKLKNDYGFTDEIKYTYVLHSGDLMKGMKIENRVMD